MLLSKVSIVQKGRLVEDRCFVKDEYSARLVYASIETLSVA